VVALGEAEQGEAGLRVAAVLVGLPIGLLGADQVAAEPAYLADLVVRVGDGEHVDPDHVVARAERLLLGLVPVAPVLQDLGPVHSTDAWVERGQGQRVGPPSGGLGPLRRPAQVPELVARIHQPAVDRSRPHGRQLVRQCCQHRLVE
jgi:hypothetical protein